MNANELRIGNWIGITDPFGKNAEYHQVLGLEYSPEMRMERGMEDDDPYFIEISENSSYAIKLCVPIPLTKEWLVRFGYKQSDSSPLSFYNKPKHYIGELVVRKKGRAFTLKGGCVMYIHQLQNLYFALTGEELTIK